MSLISYYGYLLLFILVACVINDKHSFSKQALLKGWSETFKFNICFLQKY